MLPADTVRLIQETAQKAAQPKAPPRLETGDPTRLAYYDPANAADGPIVSFDVPPAPRAHHVETLETLAALATMATATDEGHGPAVWFSVGEIVLVLDVSDRRERATMDLPHATPYSLVCQMGPDDSHTQKGLIRLLRLGLGVDNPATLDRFRRLDWTASQRTRGETRHQRESLGKEITAAVQGVEEIPDTLCVAVPVYNLPEMPCPQDVKLALEVDAGEQRFCLVPLPGQVEAAEARAADLVLDALTDALPDTVPVYCGRP